ncbi:MAG: glycosyltransferase, partial [Chthoniobacteraceae bacterium]
MIDIRAGCEPHWGVRIALLHYSLTPIVGGVEIVMAAHAKIFRAAGHEVVLICQRGPAGDRATRNLSTAPGSRELAEALDGMDLAIVHNVMTMPFDLELTAALWELAETRPAMKFVAWIHDLAALNADYGFDRQAEPWQRLSAASPHFEYVAVSEFRARQFGSLTGATARVIPN